MGWMIRARGFSLLQTYKLTLGPSFLVSVYWSFFQVINQPGREVNHSCPVSAEVKMSGACLYSLCVPSWHGQGQLDLFYTFVCCGSRGRRTVPAEA